MSDSWTPLAMYNEMGFALAAPSAWQSLGKCIYFSKVALDFTKVTGLVKGLEGSVATFEMLLAVNYACKVCAVVVT